MNTQRILSEFDDQIGFWIEEMEASKHDYPYLALAQSEVDRIAGVRKQFEIVVEAFEAHGVGLELANADESRWAIVLSDASEPGKYRYQAFTADGFYAHVTRDTLEDVLLEAVNDGFVKPCEGVLSSLAGTQQWRKGVMVTDIIWRLNTGALTPAEAEQECERLNHAS